MSHEISGSAHDPSVSDWNHDKVEKVTYHNTNLIAYLRIFLKKYLVLAISLSLWMSVDSADGTFAVQLSNSEEYRVFDPLGLPYAFYICHIKIPLKEVRNLLFKIGSEFKIYQTVRGNEL